LPSFVVTPLIVATALFMENLDGTVIATALPAMAADLHEDPVALKLALTSYLLSLAVFIPLSGWMADRYGARKVFRAAIFVFTLGSIFCGVSSTLTEVVLSRIAQGLGGAMMVPVGRLVLLRTAPRHELVRALAYLTVPALIGPAIGPPLGGFIATYFHWRFIFWINAPIGLLGMALVTRFIPDLREEQTWPLDMKGFVLSGFGLAALIFGLSFVGRDYAPSFVTIALILSGAVSLAAYVRHARVTPYPIIDLRLMRIPTFHAAILGGFVFRIGLGAIPFLLPLMLQMGFGMTAFQSGSLTFVSAIGAIAMKTTAQPILRWLGFRRVLMLNALISVGFFFGMGFFTAATAHWVIIATLLAGGFFRSLQFTALNAIGYADIDRSDMSRATSFSSVAQQLSLSAGVAVGAAALEAVRGLHGGGALRAEDFPLAFFIVAAFAAASAFFFWRLPADAGVELTRRGEREEIVEAE
jgi:EmrB/QacA subfamily drug resistance transporter